MNTYKLIYLPISLILLSASGYVIYTLSSKISQTEATFVLYKNESENSLEDFQNKYDELKKENEEMNTLLSDTQKQKLDLERTKRSNERRIDTLEKLTTIDPELLQKYSKVFFLNENYKPTGLVDIQKEFVSDQTRTLQIHEDVSYFLEKMFTDAQEENIDLRVISAYRSFETQKSLKSAYKITYGAGTANQFSAEQGYSEHQLGTAIDIGTPEVTGAYLSFEKTDAFTWLTQNAYKYGFILSYPKSNTYYTYEPWHWRFIGRKLATYLNREEIYFYEMDQRDIDEYLIKIFDK